MLSKRYIYEEMRINFYSFLFLFSVLFVFATSCKHKKHLVDTKKKAVSTKTPKSEKANAGESSTNETNNNVTLVQQKLGITEKEIKNNKLYSFICDWYGVPYKYGGCQKTGVDCSCFTNLLVEKIYDKKLERTSGSMYNACHKITLDELKEGDLVFFKINGTAISHVGVYLKNRLFAHASTSKGVIINSIDEAYYKKYFHSGGSYKNL
jgi:murein DD-endopeptidase / murein LD-carboxypeptidase